MFLIVQKQLLSYKELQPPLIGLRGEGNIHVAELKICISSIEMVLFNSKFLCFKLFL